MYYVYVLKSKSSGRYYIGQTKDLEKRIDRHNRGNSKYTRGRGPWELIYNENFSSRHLAIKRENYLKKLKSKDYINREILGCR